MLRSGGSAGAKAVTGRDGKAGEPCTVRYGTVPYRTVPYLRKSITVPYGMVSQGLATLANHVEHVSLRMYVQYLETIGLPFRLQFAITSVDKTVVTPG